MSMQDLTAKVRELKELKAMAEELNASITAIEDELKTVMLAAGSEEMQVDVFKLRYKLVESKRFSSSTFKAKYPELYDQYTEVTTYRRFSVA